MQRLSIFNNQFEPAMTAAEAAPAKKDSLSVVDNRTGNLHSLGFILIIGKTYELPIKDGAINATDLGKIKDAAGEVTRSYDPAYMNTVNCVSISTMHETQNAAIEIYIFNQNIF